jgi:hypothetical protein
MVWGGRHKMSELIFFVAIAIYPYVAYKSIRWVINKTPKKLYWALSVLFFLLLPIWDVVVGKVYFNYLCHKDAGLKVYKSVKVDGFLDSDVFDDKPSPLNLDKAKRLLSYGFKFYEAPTYKGQVIHFYLDKNNSVFYKLLAKPESQYGYFGYPSLYTPATVDISLLLHIKQSKQGIVELSSGKAVIENIAYQRIGWLALRLEEIIGSTSPHYEVCCAEDYKTELLYQKIKGKNQ